MNSLKALGKEYLTTENPFKKSAILKQAEKEIKALKFSSYTKTLKELGLSYLVGVNSSSKVIKGQKKGVRTAVLYLSASDNAGINVCPKASEGCRKACLVSSGRALMDIKSGKLVILTSRVVKTWLAVWNKPVFTELVSHELRKYKRQAENKGENFAVRLNGTSDLFLGYIYRKFPDVQFYEYTKVLRYAERLRKYDNVHFTFSYAEDNRNDIIKAFNMGLNIAVPVIDQSFDEILTDSMAYNADETDLRYLDSKLYPSGRFAILKVKRSENWEQGVKAGFILDSNGFKNLKAILTTNKKVA